LRDPRKMTVDGWEY